MNRPALFAALTLALFAASASAERYRVDLILFADRSGVGGESARPVQAPDLKGSIEPYETAQLRAAGIEMIPDEQFGLGEAWGHLRNSRNHQPLLRLAWYQKDPPTERTVSLHLHYGTPFSELTPGGSSSVYPVDGTVALIVGRYLHLDADLAFTQAAGTGELSSYRLHERRRLRRDELHHIDSPRLGMLVRAQKADPKADAAPKAAPKPSAKPPQKKKK
jgi:hypothetical protein